MDNKFSSFVETYAEDIKAFFEAFRNFIAAIIEKLTAAPEEDTEAAE